MRRCQWPQLQSEVCPADLPAPGAKLLCMWATPQRNTAKTFFLVWRHCLALLGCVPSSAGASGALPAAPQVQAQPQRPPGEAPARLHEISLTAPPLLELLVYMSWTKMPARAKSLTRTVLSMAACGGGHGLHRGLMLLRPLLTGGGFVLRQPKLQHNSDRSWAERYFCYSATAAQKYQVHRRSHSTATHILHAYTHKYV